MNESAQVSGVKALSDDDVANHLRAINEHRKAINRHQRGMRMHLQSLLDLVDDDDESPLLEGEDDGDDDKGFRLELRKLAEQAEALATA